MDYYETKPQVTYCYDEETKKVRVPRIFNDKINDLPPDAEILFFEEDLEDYFGSEFNQEVGHQGCADDSCPHNLPNSLKNISFGYYFNQRVDNLPNSLTHLTFGGTFNRKVNKLPKGLIYLTFRGSFNQKVNNLPNNLRHLTFGARFKQKIDMLPDSITHLTFVRYENIKKLPTGLKYLAFDSTCANISNIPLHIKSIGILFEDPGYYDYESLFRWKRIKIIDNLPPHIEQIKIRGAYELKFLKKIPFNCKIVDKDDNVIFFNN